MSKRAYAKRLLAVLVTLCLVLVPSSFPFAADEAAASDIDGHWGEAVMQKWIDEGKLTGDQAGVYRPNANITRAEFMALINRMNEYTEESGDVAKYKDVSPSAWYAKEVAKALAAGYVSGTSADTMSPAKSITRQEAVIMVLKAQGVSAATDLSILALAVDGESTANWAKVYMAGAMAGGYIGGSNGKVTPLAAITRAETVTLLDRVETGIRTYCFGAYGPGEGTQTIKGAIIGAPDVTLRNTVVEGDVVVSAAVNAGKVTLSNLKVAGKVLVQGESTEGISFDAVDAASIECGESEPVISYSGLHDFDGYAMFPAGTAGTAKLSVPLVNGAFAESVQVAQVNAGALPAGFTLRSVTRESNARLSVEIAYDGKHFFAGDLGLALKPEAVTDMKEALSVPLLAEVELAAKIPFGARLIRETGLGGAVEDVSSDIVPSPYYETPDFYNLESGGSLTMLHNFRTVQQATGWTCGLSAATMVVDWYGAREGDGYLLNELDLATLRGEGRERDNATTLAEMQNVFDGLNSQYGRDWEYVSTDDVIFDDMSVVVDDQGTKKDLFWEAIPYFLEKGIPITVGWQDWGGHYQVIVGYDNMGTEHTSDDVLIFADPYDTTDHNDDGFIVQPYERFVYDWSASFDPEYDSCIFIAAWPEGWIYTDNGTRGISKDMNNKGVFTDDSTIKYGDTAYFTRLKEQLVGMSKIAPYDKDFPISFYGENGLSGPADDAFFRAGDFVNSPYYKSLDVYNLKDKSIGNLQILEKFQTTQQANEYDCGVTSMLMAINHFGVMGDLTEIDLANLRQKDDGLPGTTVKEMVNAAKGLETEYDQKWNVLSSADVIEDEDEYSVTGLGVETGDGFLELSAMIPYYIQKGIPVMVMWHEWGGHWQVIIGYDDMGTPGTQDDVLILADPYDTTDHNQNGYVIESYERLIYDWGNAYDEDVPYAAFIVMEPVK